LSRRQRERYDESEGTPAEGTSQPRKPPFRRDGAPGGSVRLSPSPTARQPHIFVHPDVPKLVNLQDVNGAAKPYQVRQFLKLTERYDLRPGGRR